MDFPLPCDFCISAIFAIVKSQNVTGLPYCPRSTDGSLDDPNSHKSRCVCFDSPAITSYQWFKWSIQNIWTCSDWRVFFHCASCWFLTSPCSFWSITAIDVWENDGFKWPKRASGRLGCYDLSDQLSKWVFKLNQWEWTPLVSNWFCSKCHMAQPGISCLCVEYDPGCTSNK